jgi:hypothetical protein
LVGPDPPDPTNPGERSRWNRRLTWRLRLIVVGCAFLFGLVGSKTSGGIQVGWALQYALLAAVSIVASFWLPILLTNLFMAGIWLALSWGAPHWHTPTIVSRIVKWLNRQIGHIEAGATWVAVAVVITHRLWFQLGGLAAVILLGIPLINGLARLDTFGGKEARRNRAALLEERRSVIYLSTVLGMALLALRAPSQIAPLFPLFLTVVPGLSLRYVRFRTEKSRRGREPVPRKPIQDLRDVTVARRTGWVAPAVILVVLTLTVAWAARQRQRERRETFAAQDGPPLPKNACIAEQGGPVVPTLAVFLIADTQIHALAGYRFPGQMEIANALVPVCRRPVELDMLSTAAVLRTATVYGEVQHDRAGRGLAPALWAHLGDFADLSCLKEMTRMTSLLARFSTNARLLAGIAPGNHDSAFQGNFNWSPYWSTACDQRLDKQNSDRALGEVMARLLWPKADSEIVSGRFPDSLFQKAVAARYTISRLGTVPTSAKSERGVLGIFIDTSDRRARDFGVAGSFGSFSKEQREQIVAQVRDLRADASPVDPWSDPWFVIFDHIPYRELAHPSQIQLAELVATLDAPPPTCAAGGPECKDSRVIGLVSAHTHVAGSHRHCLAERLVREIIVGSVIDPPEQAALMEIGLDAAGRASIRLATMPTVARPGLACSTAHAISAADCKTTLARLGQSPACSDLLVNTDTSEQPGRSCGVLDADPAKLWDEIEGIIEHGGPDDPDELKAIDTRRAQTLLRCICRPEVGSQSAGCESAIADPLTNEAYAPIIETIAHDPNRQEELACLGWAAAALQAHKANGMTISDALRCAFDDTALPPAQVTVASADRVACP